VEAILKLEAEWNEARAVLIHTG